MLSDVLDLLHGIYLLHYNPGLQVCRAISPPRYTYRTRTLLASSCIAHRLGWWGFKWCVSLCLAAAFATFAAGNGCGCGPWMHAHGWPVVTIWFAAWDKIMMVWLGRDPSSCLPLLFIISDTEGELVASLNMVLLLTQN
jgi:hypothetical protein